MQLNLDKNKVRDGPDRKARTAYVSDLRILVGPCPDICRDALSAGLGQVVCWLVLVAKGKGFRA